MAGKSPTMTTTTAAQKTTEIPAITNAAFKQRKWARLFLFLGQ